jgi:cytochrome c oxidase subunit 2
MRLGRKLFFVLAAFALVFLVGCQGMQSALDPVGPQSEKLADLFWLMFWVSTVVFVLVTGSLLWAVWRQRAPDPAELTPLPISDAQERKRTRVVATSVLLTVLILFGLLFASVHAGKRIGGLESKNPISIQVIGHQWWWEVRYPNPQADLIVTTANEIHVPVGVPVVINTASRDVIHSFWAPNIQGKRDLIPGYQSAIWMQVDKPGIFRGQCAEFCGHQHAHMAFYIVAEPMDEFQAWLEQQRKPAPQPSEASVQRGHDVFLSSACVLCHTVRGTIAGSRIGPDLTHVSSRRHIAAGTLENTRGNLAGWIVDAQSIKPGVRMPPNNLAPEDLQSLLNYLETLK